MVLLFSEFSSPRLDEIVRPGMLCAFDFDGTLAPIVAQPDQARLPLPILQRLVELSAHTPVAIITGRSVPDVRARLGFEPHFLIGNHGLEGVPGWEHLAERSERLCRHWDAALTDALKNRDLFDPGIWLENKDYSLSVHYRRAQDRAQAEQQLASLVAGLSPPARIVRGKCVFNLLPPDAPNKGMALEQLMELSGAPSALYVGDDVTDEDVFRLQRPDLLTVRIGHASDSGAEFFLNDRIDVPGLLDGLIARLR